ncbi:VOC family protein [Dermatobacter hominis]|uniref:VOC family protein n=1 Tax=Dermatobacter hominis TaxID=2884263 RepID=UPI001D1012A9|nr:VOC family protein [Dermatobacter hominis]UDY34064.1 VOC family protein [Dermatobacter hominis]
MPRIVPNLWFDMDAEEAVAFYLSVFPDSRVVSRSPYTESGPGPTGETMVIDFELDGQPFTAINGGPQFTFDEAVSFLVECEDQAELDRYWDALLAGGGQESQCGWLKDRFGLSWQVVPKGMAAMMEGDPEAVDRAVRAMLGMVKLDVAALQAAYDGTA